MANNAGHAPAGTSPSISAGSLDEQTCRGLGSALRAMYNRFEKENLPEQLQELVDRFGEKRGDQ
jgi:hypothetical protein